MEFNSAFKGLKTFSKNNKSGTVMQQIFRRHFNNRKHITVPDNKSIKNWTQNFRSTASATNKTPEAQSEMRGQQKTLKEYQPLSVEAPKDQHVDINSVVLDMNRSLREIF
jgi:hypothetical protein